MLAAFKCHVFFRLCRKEKRNTEAIRQIKNKMQENPRINEITYIQFNKQNNHREKEKMRTPKTTSNAYKFYVL